MSAGYVYVLPYALHLGGAQVGMLYISAWASALLVLATVGNAKALNRGTSNRYRLPRFFFYVFLYYRTSFARSGEFGGWNVWL